MAGDVQKDSWERLTALSSIVLGVYLPIVFSRGSRHSTANRRKPVGTATTLTWPRTSFAKLEPSPAMPPARTTRPWRIGQV